MKIITFSNAFSSKIVVFFRIKKLVPIHLTFLHAHTLTQVNKTILD